MITSHIAISFYQEHADLESYFRIAKSHQHPCHDCLPNFMGRFSEMTP